MKQLLDKMKGIRGLGWLLALGVGAALCLLWPGASSGGAAMSAQEMRISATLSAIAGAGETRVSVYYAGEDGVLSSGGKPPVGAVIVAAGAGDVGVRLNLLQAAQALLGLPAGAIAVFPMEAAP